MVEAYTGGGDGIAERKVTVFDDFPVFYLESHYSIFPNFYFSGISSCQYVVLQDTWRLTDTPSGVRPSPGLSALLFDGEPL
jgi:hypothetical protein